MAKLQRKISIGMLIIAGLGTMVGAGIYVLVGKVAGEAGFFAPISFVIGAIIALFTSFSYGELSSRYPKSSGEVVYIEKGLSSRFLPVIVGWMVVFTGVISAATLANGFSGYFRELFEIPSWIVICCYVFILTIIASLGIGNSIKVTFLTTSLAIFGLLWVVFTITTPSELVANWQKIIPDFAWNDWRGILLGTLLSFYAFIGFEDMVNLAEEVDNPRKHLPIAIVVALVMATCMYILVMSAAVISYTPEQLSSSEAPLVTMIKEKGQTYALVITLIGLISVINGALVQIIMSSRIIYGMADDNMISGFFGKISPKTEVPIRATFLVSISILLFALWLPLETLARLTSIVILCVYALIHLSLIRIKRSSSEKSPTSYPMLFPILGFTMIVVFLIFSALQKANII